MRSYSLISLLIAASALCLGACGGSSKPAEEPIATEPEKEEAPAEAKTDAASPEKTEEKPSEPAVTRTAKDIVTAPEVTFMFSFNQSEPKEKAEAKCSETAKDDPKKMALCMKKASSKFEADGIQFKKNDKGGEDDWLWITVRRKGNVLTTIHKIPVTFAEDKATSVTLKPTGKDTGTKPMTPPSEVLIEVPNEFSIVLKDPDHGRMVYEAKIGITSADKSVQ
jgi:hypothetical protein